VGAEFFAGIPGTMGGALAMNAGAWGGETWDRVCLVETIDRNGQLHHRLPAEFDVGYRYCKPVDLRLDEEWFVAAHLRLEPGDGGASLRLIRQLLEQRSQTQPVGVASCGSVFRNPPHDHAARLIDATGLKGVCVGNACVSTKHANFIVNTGCATAAEIESLMQEVIAAVDHRYGVRLIPEVRIVGETVSERA
jgi:UDP-N-acetylmuramate dehydrogenase